MLHYFMEERGNTPRYIYLYECIKKDIAAGVLESGEKLPSKRTMAQSLGVGLITVANAYDLLEAEGYVRSEERRGYFVQELPAEYFTIAARAAAGGKEKPAPGASPEEPALLRSDLNVNRISMRLFPKNIWNQLMRKTINQGDELYEVVPFNGVYALRRAIAENLRSSRGMVVSPDQIVIGAGTEYLYNRLTQLFGRSAVFGFEDPGYEKLSMIVRSAGNLARFIPIDDYGMMVDVLEESDVDIVHVSPASHFPTGIAMPVGRRTELLEWTYRSSKRYIIEDEYDSEFRYKGNYLSPIWCTDSRDRTIYMNTFSKTMVPSLRISYMVLPPKLMQRYRESMSFYSCTVSAFEQYTLARFLDEGYFERHIHRIKNYYRKLRLQVLHALETSPLSKISEVIEYNAGTHFMLLVHTALSKEEVRAAAAEAGFAISFASDYAHEVSSESFRPLLINYAAIEPEQVDEVIALLAGLFPECHQKGDD